MHLGKDQEFSTYSMQQNGAPVIINQVTVQKDLGVTINNKFKFVPHIQPMVKKANRNLGIIKKSFSYLEKTVQNDCAPPLRISLHSLVSFIQEK